MEGERATIDQGKRGHAPAIVETRAATDFDHAINDRSNRVMIIYRFIYGSFQVLYLGI